MMKLPKNKGWIIMLLSLLCLHLPAQSFQYQASLNPVRQTGFYAIPVSPKLSVHMQTDFRDVRIWDDKEKQVPYITRSRKPKWERSLFQPFPVVENRLDDSGRSVVVVQKNISAAISGLSLIIKNASVSRYAAFSGSNDGKRWFIISDQLLINDSYETGADSSIQSIAFPPSAYPFYRLVIDNYKRDPLNIVSIGYYPPQEQMLPEQDQYQVNPVPVFTQKDSNNGTSYIRVHQKQNFLVQKIRMVVNRPPFFSRQFTVSGKNRFTNEPVSFSKIMKSSSMLNDSVMEQELPDGVGGAFMIAITNGDNPPLHIRSVETEQTYHEIVAYLEAGKQYKLLMGATNAPIPDYDLQQFTDSIPVAVPLLTIKEITAIAPSVATESKSFPHRYIWLIMLGIVALLGLLTWRLTTEMRKNV